MKVLYVSKALGVAAYRDKIRDLRRHLDVLALAPDHWPPLGIEPDREAAPWMRLQAVRFAGLPHLHVYRGLGSILRSFGPDLVHIDEEPYSAVSWQLVRRCREHRVRSVCFAWQNLAKRLPPPFGSMQSYVLRHVSGAIAGTARAARLLAARGYAGPLAIIPQFGVSPHRYVPRPDVRRRCREAAGAGDADLVVGFAGRLVPEKGVDLVIRAAAAAAWRVVVLGDGPERRTLERLARDLGAADRCYFAGRVDSTSVPDWLLALDAVALPSRGTRRWKEQFGRILVEAMAAGVPVIGSDSGAIPGVIGDAGLVVRENDLIGLTEALTRLAASAEERRALGCKGRDRAFNRFTSARIAEDTVAFYRGLMNQPGPS